MRKILRRPSPATVLSLVALFVALGGTSYAAISIGGKNVRNGSLTGADVKNSSLTGKDVKNNKLTGADVTSLKGADVTNESLTGSDVNEGSLGKVPSAGTADSATNATNATNATKAGNAGTVGGLAVKKFRFFRAGAATNVPVVSLGGLTVRASCSATGGTLTITAVSSVDNATIHAQTQQNEAIFIPESTDSGGDTNPAGASYGYDEEETDDFDQGDTFDPFDGTPADSQEGQLTYVTPSGGVAHVNFLAEEEGANDDECLFAGVAVGG